MSDQETLQSMEAVQDALERFGEETVTEAQHRALDHYLKLAYLRYGITAPNTYLAVVKQYEWDLLKTLHPFHRQQSLMELAQTVTDTTE